MVVVLLGLAGPFGALVWLLARPSTKVVERSIDAYVDAGDALAAAASLDQLGEWDAAIRSYRYAAQRWPDQCDYAESCIKQIEDKQALT